MNRWRKIGNAYRLTDEYSTLWVRKIGTRWHLIHRHNNGWGTLATHPTLASAQADGAALMAVIA